MGKELVRNERTGGKEEASDEDPRAPFCRDVEHGDEESEKEQ
jgi:hypothetical protein